MLFEKIIPYHTPACILLSNRLAATISTPTSANMVLYLEQLEIVMGFLQHRTPLLQTPLFQWHDVNSTCWYFEQYRCLYTLHTLLVSEAQTLFAAQKHKESKKLLAQAVDCCHKLLQLHWYRTPHVAAMPEMQQTHVLSKLLSTKGLYYYNAHCFKNTRIAAKLAYQLTEVADCLWKATANPTFTHKLLAEAHYAEATHTQVFQEKLSYITAAEQLVAKHNLHLPHVNELYASILDANATVHYEQCTPISYPVLTVAQCLEFVSIKTETP